MLYICMSVYSAMRILLNTPCVSFQYLELRFKSRVVRVMGTVLGMLGYVSLYYLICTYKAKYRYFN